MPIKPLVCFFIGEKSICVRNRDTIVYSFSVTASTIPKDNTILWATSTNNIIQSVKFEISLVSGKVSLICDKTFKNNQSYMLIIESKHEMEMF